ncbi:MAG TPA: SDR family oxidoreductase [Armatimonadota bacterium]|jgi:NAD(P)-dependent dehydrogenase (short-subunit alcohol dehydrogenase family)
MLLQNRTVLIFGGSSGIGLATGQAAAAAGARVVVVGRRKDALDQAVGLIGPGASAVAADIGIEADVRRVFETAGEVDHVVTTAANLTYAPITEFQMEDAQRVLDSKLLGPLMVAKHAGKRLPATGSITFISGVAAYKPMPGGAMVGAANAALESLAQTAAVELAPIRVNVVSPGVVDTPSWSGMPADDRRRYFASLAATLPARRIGQPEDLAQAILAVMTNAYITGTVLHVDGGHRLV